jgi:membrane protease YdiL (CAAX protease family)
MITRVLELLALFVAVPAAIRWGRFRRSPLLILAGGCAAALAVLLLDPSFDRSRLWNGAAVIEHAGAIALLCAASLPVLYAVARWLEPDEIFAMVRRRPWLWLLIMVAYPIVSVYPQELLYRAFLFQRYAPFLTTPAARIAVSAIVFAWGHVFFRRPWVAMLLTLVGGMVFAWHYEVTRSLAVASVEHAIFGDLVFSIGLGRYFFHRATREGEVHLARSS